MNKKLTQLFDDVENLKFWRRRPILRRRMRQLHKYIKELEGYKEGARDCLLSAKKRIAELETQKTSLKGGK